MKKLLIIAICLSGCLVVTPASAQLLKKIKDKVSQRADQKTDQTIDKGLDKAEEGAKGNKKDKSSDKDKDKDNKTEESTGQPAAPSAPPSFKTYQNYDFVPGDKVLFEDHFTDDQDGEFPAHWKLSAGQAVLNKVDNTLSFLLTEGNYVRVEPRMKTEKYLPENFTLEFDFYMKEGSYTPGLLFTNSNVETGGSRYLFFGPETSTSYFSRDLSGQYPGDKDHFYDKWHHAAMIKKGNQLKLYLDQYRVLTVPDCDCAATNVEVGGIGNPDQPIVFTNFRLAEGGGMNMIGKKFTDAKIVTHGINFDYNKATLKPESMGTLNMIVKVMQENPEIKFEVGGHTDADGEDTYNMKLSQQRADAVKEQLIKLGIDASRLTAKGYGESKPISDNQSPEGKANNRRVEFVKM